MSMELEGKNIHLRLLEEPDLAARVRWVNDPEIRKTLMFDYPLSLAKTKAWFQKTLFDASKVNFSIMDKATGMLIGMTGLLDVNYRHQKAQFYITIGEKEFWGRRIADEVIRLVVRYGFVELNLNKIYLYTLPSNDRGRKVYERNGFVKEGILRQHYYCVGQFQDLIVHGLLRSDWDKVANGGLDAANARGGVA